MNARVALIAQKRASLRRQIAALATVLGQDEPIPVEARLRLNRVRELFHAYEELHDELALLEIDQEGLGEMEEISNAFYELAAKVETADRSIANSSRSGMPIGTSTFVEKQRLLKLPVAELPKFDGDIDKWLSFKNTFKTMVDARTDINDLVKFLYLKNCLTGEAANKIQAYNASDENYANAWELLTSAYERKRILMSKHLDAILDIPKLTDASSKSLSGMVDTVRQHVNMLEILEFKLPDYAIVRTLEKALPHEIRLKWEESLTLDDIPTLKDFYKFIGGVVFRLHTMERDAESSRVARGGKRQGGREWHGSKTKRIESGSRALVTVASDSCVLCYGEQHVIYRCPVFEKMTLQRRWDTVKAKGLCRNCLRKHAGECTVSRCKQCGQFHHTLLHTAKPRASASASKPVSNFGTQP